MRDPIRISYLFSDILQVTEGNHARVGADDVELAEVLNRLIHELDDLVSLANVGLDCNGVAAVLLDLLYDLVRGFTRVGIVDDDLCAALAQLGGDSSTNATAGAGDKGDFAVEAEVVGLRSRHWDGRPEGDV
jgi:hypothetical protein